MAILNIQIDQAGLSGIRPHFIYIETNNTFDEVVAPGFLNGIVQKFGIPLSEYQMAQVSTKTSPNDRSTQLNLFSVIETNGNWSLLNVNTSSLQQFFGLENIIYTSGGTWTNTRFIQGLYGRVHTPAAETVGFSVDISPIINIATLQGFRLDSFDVIYTIGTAAMTTNSVTLSQVSFQNNVAPIPSLIPLTGSLATSIQGNVYSTNIAITTPSFINVPNSAYILEFSTGFQATTTYSYLGTNLHFTLNQTIN
jgi:hypothetical protein